MLSQSETRIIVPVVRVVPVTNGHLAIVIIVVPRAAPQHTTGFDTASSAAKLKNFFGASRHIKKG